MSGISVTLHGDVPYASEAHKKQFCSKCRRVQGEWKVYQRNTAWFKKCTVCKTEVSIKDPKAVAALNKEKTAMSLKKNATIKAKPK